MNDSPPPRGRFGAWLERLLCRGRLAFYLAACAAVAAALIPGYGVYHFMQLRLDYQRLRIDYLAAETGKLAPQVVEAMRILQQTEALISRKETVEALRDRRASAVAVFNFLARGVPQDVQLVQVRFGRGGLELQGRSRSGEGAAALMRAIERDPWLDKPTLVSSAPGGEAQEFTVAAKVRARPEAAPAAPASSPAAPSRPAPSAPGASEDEADAGWPGLAILGGVMVFAAAGLVVRRWLRRRAASRGPRGPVFARAAQEFEAMSLWRLSTWGLAPRIAVLLELCLVTAVVCWFGIGAALDKYSDATEAEGKLKSKFLEVKRMAMNLDLTTKQLVDAQQTYGPLLKSVPATLDARALESAIRSAARKAGATVTRLDLQPAASAPDGLARLPAALGAEGGFNDIGAFAGHLANMQPPVRLDSFELYPGAGQGKNMKLRFIAEVAAYRYASPEELSAWKSKGATK